MTIGERIHNRRVEIGMSVDDLAKRLNVARTTVYRYESDEICNMSVNVIPLLADALRTTTEYLLGYDENAQEETVEAMAERLHKNPNLRMLFDASEGATPEQLKICADMLEQFKKGNSK